MSRKSLYDISWQVSEEEYREDPAYSYSTLAKYERGGFDVLSTLTDKVESPSLTFGSAVDSIITGGQEEFDSRFMVADFPDIPDSIIKIVKCLFDSYSELYTSITDIPDNNILNVAIQFGYQSNWKEDTRVKVIKEKGDQYYNLLYLSQNKEILSTSLYTDVLNTVEALKTSISTKDYFADDPFAINKEKFYQLKFKATFNNINYRCMADLIIVDHNTKTVYPIDLKTSGKNEWEFHKSFIQWSYAIQARLYWRIIRDVMNKDDFYKDYKLDDYRFIVVNKFSLTPLVWLFPMTTTVGTILVGTDSKIELRDPFTIAEELDYYLKNKPKVPVGINLVGDNNLRNWLIEL